MRRWLKSGWVAVGARLAVVLATGAAATGCADVLTYAQASRETGMVAYNQGDYPKAAGAFRSALRQDPRDYLSHYYLGKSSLEMRNYQQALVAFRSCLETQNLSLAGKEDDDTRLKALDGLAQSIVKSDDTDVEVNKVEQTARSAKGAAAAREFFVLAKVYRYRMLPDMALDFYNRAAVNDPKNFAYAKEYGLYCVQLQQTDKARDALRQAFSVNQNDTEVNDALRGLGIVLGPSLKDRQDLVQPPLPKGPIPVVDLAKLGIGGQQGESQPARSIIPPGQQQPQSLQPVGVQGTRAAPRD